MKYFIFVMAFLVSGTANAVLNEDYIEPYYSDPNEYSAFGSAIAMTETWLFAGNFMHDYEATLFFPAIEDGGIVEVYKKVNGTWEFHSTIEYRVTSEVNFGISVSVDNDKLVIGAPGYNDENGRVIFYKYNPATDTWQLKHSINKPADGGMGAQFGYRVAVHGNCLAVSAHNDSQTHTLSGGFYVYSYNTYTNTWYEKRGSSGLPIITEYPFNGGQQYTHAGVSIAVQDMGSYCHTLVGSHLHDHNLYTPSTGAVYFFDYSKSGNSVYNKQLLDGYNQGYTENYSYFGYAVGLAGNRAVIGIPGYDLGRGAIKTYLFYNNTLNQYNLTYGGYTRPGTQFGSTIAMNSKILAVAAIQADSYEDTGYTVIYKQNRPAPYSFYEYVEPSDGDFIDYFGCGLAVPYDSTEDGSIDVAVGSIPPNKIYIYSE